MRRLDPGRMLLTAAVAAAAVAFQAASAGACDSSSCALLTRGQNGVLAKGLFRVDFSFRYTDDGVKLRGSDAVDEVVMPKVAFEHKLVWPAYHREVGGHESYVQMDLGYGLTSRLSLVASLPVDARSSFTIAHFGIEQRYRTDGVGDALVGARLTLRRNLVTGFSVKLPTGPHAIAGDFDGSILDPMLQPGTGSFDFVGTLQQSGRIAPLGLGLSGALSYQANTKNDLNYRFGNDTILTVNLSRPVAGRLSASFQTKLFHRDRSEYLGHSVPATGMNFVYLGPGLRLDVRGGVSVYGFLQLVGYRHVNEAQLAPRAAFLTGVSKTF